MSLHRLRSLYKRQETVRSCYNAWVMENTVRICTSPAAIAAGNATALAGGC